MRIMVGREARTLNRPVRGIAHHAAKLEHAEAAASVAVPLLHKEDRTRAGELDGQPDQQEDWRQQYNSRGRAQNIENALRCLGRFTAVVLGHELNEQCRSPAEIFFLRQRKYIVQANHTHAGSLGYRYRALGQVVAGAHGSSDDEFVDDISQQISRQIVDIANQAAGNVWRHRIGMAVIHEAQKALRAVMLDAQLTPRLACTPAAPYDDDPLRLNDMPTPVVAARQHPAGFIEERQPAGSFPGFALPVLEHGGLAGTSPEAPS